MPLGKATRGLEMLLGINIRLSNFKGLLARPRAFLRQKYLVETVLRLEQQVAVNPSYR